MDAYIVSVVKMCRVHFLLFNEMPVFILTIEPADIVADRYRAMSASLKAH